MGVFESGDDEYPVEQCSGRELPALDLLNYLNSEPRQADDHSGAVLYCSGCLVKAACSEAMFAGEGRNGVFITYP